MLVDDHVLMCSLQCGMCCYDTEALRGDTKCKWQNLLSTWWWPWAWCLTQRYYLFCWTLQPECVLVCVSQWAHMHTIHSLPLPLQTNTSNVLSLFNSSTGSFCRHYPRGLFIVLRDGNAIKPLAVKTKPLFFRITLIVRWHKKHSSLEYGDESNQKHTIIFVL